MQFPGMSGPPPTGVVFDCDLATIDDALALALLFGLDGKNECRVASLSISRPSVNAAAFADVVQRFYAGAAAAFMRSLPVGMALEGAKPGAEALVDAPLAKPELKPAVLKLNDTADAAALVRNAFTAYHDGNCMGVLAGPSINYRQALSLRGAREIFTAKCRSLTVLPDPSDVEHTSKLLAEWPSPVFVIDPEIGNQIKFPAATIETGFAWTPAHPVAEAYKAHKPMPYDAPTGSLAAVLSAVRSKANYFKVSEPGVITLDASGKPKHAPAADGRHRLVSFDPAQAEKVLAVYTELVSAKPVPRARFRPGAAKPKPDPTKPDSTKPDTTKPAPGKPAEAKPPQATQP